MTALTDRILTDALVTALRRLGDAGQPGEANTLAARTYSSLRREEPHIAGRLNGVMHYLARLEAATPFDERTSEMAEPRLLDVRGEPPVRRHTVIFGTFAELAVDDAFVLVNDHDPKPLYYQLAAEQAGTFSWDYLEQGPEVWRVRIARTAPAAPAASRAS